MATMMSAPPIVGVPFFERCDCGPSSRTTWPICFFCSSRMNHGDSTKLISIAVIVGLGTIYASLEPRYRLADQVPDKQQAVSASSRLDAKLTGANPIDILIEFPKGASLYAPGTLATIADVHTIVEKQAGVGNVWSVDSLRRWLAEKAGKADLATLKTMLAQSPDLMRLVRSPVLGRDEQAKGMEAVLRKAGASDLTRRLVLLLARKRRLFALGNVIRAFENLIAKHRGEVAAEVTSARALNAEETAELKRVLKDKLGREPKLDMHVDPKLLGGLKLKIGSRMIDSSLRTKLDGLRAAMKGN